jgi:uncharacterized protein (TIGR02421 family)
MSVSAHRDLASFSATTFAGLATLEERLLEVAHRTRILPYLHADNAASERLRMTTELARGELPAPRWSPLARRSTHGLFHLLERARVETLRAAMPDEVRALYVGRMEELELDIALLDALGDAKRVRPLSARRYGTGTSRVRAKTAIDVAEACLAQLEPAPREPLRDVDADELARQMERAAAFVGITIRGVVDARLSAAAAAGEKTIYVQKRAFSRVEARRLVAHEVFGHLIASHRARQHPLRIFEIGVAGSFADQEGLALCLEEAAGTMDASRLRTLAARVVVTARLHEGASFGEAAREMMAHGLSPEAAIATTERAYRGGGVARDAGYLEGFVRVRDALRARVCSLDELRAGRLAVEAVPALRVAMAHGWAEPAKASPSLEEGLLHAGAAPSESSLNLDAILEQAA